MQKWFRRRCIRWSDVGVLGVLVEGRLVSSTYTAPSSFGDGQGTNTEVHTYLPDGSERVEKMNGFTDVVSESHSVVTRTAACLAIDADIGSPKDNRCRELD